MLQSTYDVTCSSVGVFIGSSFEDRDGVQT